MILQVIRRQWTVTSIEYTI